MRHNRKNSAYLATKPLRELSQREREALILDLERQRAEVIWDIEEIMKLVAKQTGQKSLKKRKYRLGESPNDFNSGR